MPVVNNWPMTRVAIDDGLAQTGVDPRVLVILQGVSDEIRRQAEDYAEREPRLLVWSHDPPLPSLSATWNRALEFVWACGGEEALVVNNDVRLHPETYVQLHVLSDLTDALFISAVGVREGQFSAHEDLPAAIWGTVDPHDHYDEALAVLRNGGTLDAAKREIVTNLPKGGPDFSCFLLSQVCHAAYPFDEAFIPAYCEDLDYHRRLMLEGDGQRIFSVNLPYLHYASRTVNSYTPEEQQRFAKRVQQSRSHYRQKWGGDVNQEAYTVPYAPESTRNDVTTPELQRRVQAGESMLPELEAI